MNVAYFDYNATHPPFLDILESSINYYSENFFNPSGPSRFSLNNQSQIESARIYFSKLTNKDKNDFVFSSTGTEANFFLLNLIKKRHEDILISPFEHSSIYESIHDLKIQFRILKTNKSGLIDLDDLEKKFKVKNSPLILIYAGNETGVIQPILEAKKILGNFPIYSDLMQAFGKIHVQFDLLSGFSFSGHKIGAGLGASLTYVENLEKDFGIFKGGNQENSHRAGTENFVSIDVFKNSSIRQLENLDIKNSKLINYKNKIESELEDLDFEIIAKNSKRLPSTIFAILPIEDVDFFMLGLEEKKILISNGSSCKSRTREASKSLLNMGYSKEESLRAIRISMGYFTTLEEVEILLQSIKELIFKLR